MSVDDSPTPPTGAPGRGGDGAPEGQWRSASAAIRSKTEAALSALLGGASRSVLGGAGGPPAR